MAVRVATSDPKPSIKLPGFDYFYFNKKLPNGTECVAVIPQSLRGIVRKNFVFDDAALRYDDELKASVLQLDFDEAPTADPALPDDPQTGWGDHDHLTASDSADPELLAQMIQNTPVIPNRGIRPATARKQAAAARAAEHNLDLDLLMILDQVCTAFNYTCKRIGVAEKPRAMEAQKIAVTAVIPWLKSKGVNLSEEEEKALSL